MNCAIIEQSEQPCPAWRLIPAAHCRTATKFGINQPRNRQVVPWPRTSVIKVAAAHPFQGSSCGCDLWLSQLAVEEAPAPAKLASRPAPPLRSLAARSALRGLSARDECDRLSGQVSTNATSEDVAPPTD